jgi:hypothetical protein
MPNRCLPVVVLALLAACGDSATSPAAGQGRFEFTDPAGDTVATTASADTFPALDATEVSGATAGDTLTLTIRFARPVAPGDRAPNSVVARLEVDADADTATGIPPTAPFVGSAHLGVDFYVFIPGSSGAGADVQDIATQQSTEYPASYGTSDVTIRIPLAALGAPVDSFRFVGVVGTPQRATDLLPDAGSYTIGVASALPR